MSFEGLRALHSAQIGERASQTSLRLPVSSGQNLKKKTFKEKAPLGSIAQIGKGVSSEQQIIQILWAAVRPRPELSQLRRVLLENFFRGSLIYLQVF